MASMPWVKMYTEILNDHKLRELRDGTKRRFALGEDDGHNRIDLLRS